MVHTDAGETAGRALPDPEEFRARCREFLAAHARGHRTGDEDDVPVPDDGHMTIEAMRARDRDLVERAKRFQAARFDAGLAALTWPPEYGGQGLPVTYERIWEEEAADYDTPTSVFTIGFGMCIPTLLTHGSEQLKRRYVRPAARGEEIWCQLFSEPGAGSDVASLQTRAVLDGDEWVVNGEKVWTSGAHYSDFGILIARTDPDVPKHRGITMFVVDMHAPGVTVEPLRQMTGGASFNQVFFDDVRIPADHVVGEVNEGWRAAITTLMNERVAIGAGGGGARRRRDPLAPLFDVARRRGLIGDPVVRDALMDLWIRQRILGLIGERIRQAVRRGEVPGPEGSVAKLAGALLARRTADVGAMLAGPEAAAWDPADRRGSRWAQSVCMAPASSIAGGTNEIMRNIIGERVLGLPKEPQVDRDIPFREVLVSTAGRRS